MPLSTVLIANRGEIACRIMRSCRALGIRTVAVYSDADKDSIHVAEADVARHIGESSPRKSYLNASAILSAAHDAGAEGIHPGYGFLAENADFAEAVMQDGLTWIGPSPRSIRAMGDKENAREMARVAGVPVLPGSPRLAKIDDQLLTTSATQIGFPLLIKAAGGGGGIGMRRADDIKQLRPMAVATHELASRSFASGDIYLERFITKARHIEVQIFGFGDGRAVHLFERECSIQRRFQKVIEEAPSPRLDATVRQEICNVAVALARQQRYAGAGTVEFVFDDEHNEFFFLEMNTRIQVEHPVTEFVTGTDIVEMQLRLARGDIPDDSPITATTGHSIECRLYAEDPAQMFLPSPGLLRTLRFPKPDNTLRIDSGVRQGDTVTPYYDPMIAKIVSGGTNREQAIHRMLRALGEIRVEGLATNLGFLINCIQHPAFVAGQTTTDFIDNYQVQLV